MTKKRILELAYIGALNIWSMENRKNLEDRTGLSAERERKANAEFDEIRNLLKELENEQN